MNKNIIKLKEILSNVLDIDSALITDCFSQNDSENWDSIRHLNLILVIEEQFQIHIDDDIIPELTSLDKLSSYINLHK